MNFEHRTSNSERRTWPGPADGFTLLEVMVAVAILGVFLVPLLITHGDTVRNLRSAREITRAALLAQSRIGTMETLGFEWLELIGEDEEMDKYPFLKMEDEVDYDEEGVLSQATVKVFPRSAKPGKNKEEDKRIGVDLEVYIVNLNFEKEEEEIVEE